jgi:hypothetical protein
MLAVVHISTKPQMWFWQYGFGKYNRRFAIEINVQKPRRLSQKQSYIMMLEMSLLECLAITMPSVLNRAFAVWMKCDEAFLLWR